MYIAEMKGKLPSRFTGWEDVLTSNVFSFFMYSSRTLYLKKLLMIIGIQDVTDDDLNEAEFSFWPVYPDGTEPDVVLLVGKYYILFEAKYYSRFGEAGKERKHQLVREVEGGTAEAVKSGRIFKLVTLTTDPCFRVEKHKEIPQEHRGSHSWINWQAITRLIEETIRGSAKPDLLAIDLCQLLVQKDLRGFRSFSGFEFAGNVPGQLFFSAKTATYRGDFIGFQEALSGLSFSAQIGKHLFFNKQFFAGLTKMISKTPSCVFYNGEGKYEQLS